MKFEGLQIDGPDDVVRHYEAGTQTRPRDEFPAEWMLRFAGHDATAREWVDEALRRLIVDRGGEELEPSRELNELINLASLIEGRKLLPLLRERLVRDTQGWSDQRAQRFLSWLVGAHPGRAGEPFEVDELERIEALGRRPGGFSSAGVIIATVAPWRLASFVREHLGDAVDRGEESLYRIAFEWVNPLMAPYRLELLLAVAEARASLTDEVRQRIEAELRLRPPLDLDGVFEAAWQDPAQQNRVFGRMLVRAYVEGGVSRRRALLVHPRDAGGLSLPASFDEYAAAVQDRGEADDAPLRWPAGRLHSVGEPEPMPEGQAGAVEMFWVPFVIEPEGGKNREDRLLIYRLGDRFKVGLALERRGKAKTS